MNVYTQKQNFSPEDFRLPPAFCGPVYSWVWNNEMDEAAIRREIGEMREMGICAAYIIPEPPEFRPGVMDTPMTPPYLSDEFFAMVRYAVEYAASQGMTMWLYDEGGWPSGTACGKVAHMVPDACAKRLVCREVELHAGDTLEPHPDTLLVTDEARRPLALPFTASADCRVKRYFVEHMRTRLPYLLDERAVRAFLDCTYEKYREHLGDLFGTAALAMFTDEAILVYPFYLADPTEFEAQSGFRVADMVYTLFEDDLTDEERRFKVEYIDYCSRQFCRTYLTTLHDWCREHGLMFTGHMDGDHLLTTYHQQGGNAMRHLREMDIPGVDVILRQIFPGQENTAFPRIASSAARQGGKPFAVSESFAVFGDGLTFEQMRFVSLYQMLRGINLINLMSVTSGRDRFLSAQCRPHFVPELPNSREFADFNRWLGRMSWLCAVGKPCVSVAVYLPARDVWAGDADAEQRFFALCRELERRQVDFDFADDDFLAAAAVKNGRLGNGHASYAAVFMPHTAWISDAAAASLSAFEAAGGLVAREGDLSAADRFASIACDRPELRVMKRCGEGETLYILFNEGEQELTFHVNCRADAPHGYRLWPHTGDMTALGDGALTLTLCAGEEAVLLYSEKTYPTVPAAPVMTRTLAVLHDFAVEQTERTTLEGECLVKRPVSGDPGDLSAFSGTLRYTAEWDCDCPTDLTVTLSGTPESYALSVNGHPCGKCLMPPYRWAVPKEVLTAHNRLEITATGTAAAAFNCACYDGVPASHLGTYHKVTAGYEQETPPMALSEVRILSE